MTYSCTDFTDSVLNQLVLYGLVDPGELPDEDPETQAEVAMEAIARLHRQTAALVRLCGGACAHHEGSSHALELPAGWHSQAAKALDDGPVRCTGEQETCSICYIRFAQADSGARTQVPNGAASGPIAGHCARLLNQGG